MSATLEVKLSDEQLDLLADRIAAKMSASAPQRNAPLSMAEAAKRLGVSRETVRLRVKAGLIRAVENLNPVRISQFEIDRLLNPSTPE